MSGTSPPPGWYETSDGRTRWWDGNEWTDHFQAVATPQSATPPSESIQTNVEPDSDPDAAISKTASLPSSADVGSKRQDEKKNKKKTKKKRTLIAVAALLVLGLGSATAVAMATAGPSDEERRIASEERASAAAEEAEREAEAELAEQKATCESAVSEFKDAVEAVDSKLNVGLVQNDFNNALGDASVAYDNLDFDAIGLDEYCLSEVAKPLEEAFNIYVRSNNKWNKCNQNFGCEVKGKVLKDLQVRWLRASLKITQVDQAFEDYGSTETSSS